MNHPPARRLFAWIVLAAMLLGALAPTADLHASF